MVLLFSCDVIIFQNCKLAILLTFKCHQIIELIKTWRFKTFKDVRAHCYRASLVRTLFIGHARATSFSSARTDSKSQQNIERMTFALTWYANIFVGSSVTPTFFPFLTLFIILKNKKNVCGKF